MFAVGQRTRGSLAGFWAPLTTTIEAIKREPQQEATGTKAPPMSTDNRISYVPRRWHLKRKIMAAAIAIFQSVRSAKRNENRPNEPNTRVFAQNCDSFIDIAAPRAAFCRLPPPTKDDARGDGFLAWAAK